MARLGTASKVTCVSWLEASLEASDSANGITTSSPLTLPMTMKALDAVLLGGVLVQPRLVRVHLRLVQVDLVLVGGHRRLIGEDVGEVGLAGIGCEWRIGEHAAVRRELGRVGGGLRLRRRQVGLVLLEREARREGRLIVGELGLVGCDLV